MNRCVMCGRSFEKWTEYHLHSLSAHERQPMCTEKKKVVVMMGEERFKDYII